MNTDQPGIPPRPQPNPPGLSLRPATDDDVAALAAIERAVHVAPWTEDNIRAEMEKPYARFLVLTDDETDTRIAGYIVYWLMFDEAQVLNVAVEPTFRRRGLARFMMRQAASEAHRKGLKRIVLDVRKSNQSAILLYQSLGFAVTSVRKNFYSNGEDAYQMSIPLEGEREEF